MANAGVSHLTFAREEFSAQVPKWFPSATARSCSASANASSEDVPEGRTGSRGGRRRADELRWTA